MSVCLLAVAFFCCFLFLSWFVAVGTFKSSEAEKIPSEKERTNFLEVKRRLLRPWGTFMW